MIIAIWIIAVCEVIKAVNILISTIELRRAHKRQEEMFREDEQAFSDRLLEAYREQTSLEELQKVARSKNNKFVDRRKGDTQ